MGLMMMSSIIFAQQKQSSPAREKHGERIKKELSLTDEQANKVKSINKDFSSKAFAVRKDSTLTKEAKREKMKSIHSEKEAALKKEMNDDQYKKYQALRREHAGKFRRGNRQFSENHADRMKKNLALSDDQTSKIKSIDKEYAAKFQELRRDSTASKEDTKKQALKLREDYRSKTKSVLTDEQLQKWDAQRKHHSKRSK